jgi:ABC-2 type transport system ATP-binding protein
MSSATTPLIRIDHLQKSYGGTDKALDIDSLTIMRGETFGIVGNNGAGKTTLFSLVLDLIRSTAGAVFIDGKQVGKDGEEYKRYTGSYLDESFLIDFLTVSEYWHFVGRLYGLTAADIEARAAVYEPLIGSNAGRDTLIRDLSRGMAKKVGIVAALLPEPRLLILDEPFANLDPGSQMQLKRFLQSVHGRFETTVLLSEHNLNMIFECCDRIAVLRAGGIIAVETTSETSVAALESFFDGTEGEAG